MKGSRSKRFAYHWPPDEKLIGKQDVPPDYDSLSKPERISFYFQSSEMACWIMKYMSPVIQSTTRKPGPSMLHNLPSHFNSPALGSTSLHYVCVMCPLIYCRFPAHHLSLWAAPTVIYILYHCQMKLHTFPMEWSLTVSQNSSVKTSFFFF